MTTQVYSKLQSIDIGFLVDDAPSLIRMLETRDQLSRDKDTSEAIFFVNGDPYVMDSNGACFSIEFETP